MKTNTTSKQIEILSVRREPQGSWKWQTPYTVRRYAARMTREGKWVWSLVSVVTAEVSGPASNNQQP